MKTKIVILAAGKGTRMKTSVPKVLIPVNGESMIKHLTRSALESEIDEKPIIVVSPENAEPIKKELGDNFEYAIQKEQLGTGHALASAKENVEEKTERIIVLNGDHPFIKTETLKKLNETLLENLAMLTVTLNDFDSWRKNFYHWGRIIRENGKIKAIREFKDASEGEKEIKEVNPAIYSFDSAWLWGNLKKIKKENAQKEYYLTDLVSLAFAQNKKIDSLPIDAKEAIGINSLEELETAEKIY